jgi:hypothetical protein
VEYCRLFSLIDNFTIFIETTDNVNDDIQPAKRISFKNLRSDINFRKGTSGHDYITHPEFRKKGSSCNLSYGAMGY